MVHLENILSEMVNKILVLSLRILELMDSRNVRREVLLGESSANFCLDVVQYESLINLIVNGLEHI